ncbi:hypothetical protein, partial [Actinokineospora sp. NBRC 105648]|uniref:hypothetical protein n=1 Tax=Actinokineospora sp. NBRC 105648 TaxID=3032206 RepID=UPI0025551125
RATFSGLSADDSVVETLRDGGPAMADPGLDGLAERFDVEGVSADFRAGILFAVRHMADLAYEY